MGDLHMTQNELQTPAPELNNINAFNEKMYRLGYEDAQNKRKFGESLQVEATSYTVNDIQVEQLKLF